MYVANDTSKFLQQFTMGKECAGETTRLAPDNQHALHSQHVLSIASHSRQGGTIFNVPRCVHLYFVHVHHVNTTSYTYPRTGHTNSYMNRILIHNKYIYIQKLNHGLLFNIFNLYLWSTNFSKKLLRVKKQTHTRMQYTQHQKQKKVR